MIKMLRGSSLLVKTVSNGSYNGSSLSKFSSTLHSTSKVAPEFQVRASSMTARIRRERIRASILPPEDFSEDLHVIYPRERLGNTYSLNFEMSRLQVINTNEAYRNLHIRGLLGRADGKFDSNKAFVFNSDSNAVTFVNGSSEDEYANLFEQVTDHISEGPYAFVHDGAVGSHQGAHVRLRVLSDSANAGLFLNYMIPKLPLKQPHEFPVDLVVYHASKFKDAQNFGFKTPGFCIFDKQNKFVIIGGTNSNSILSQGIVSGAASILLSQPENAIVPLNCDVVTGANGKTSLIISDNGLYLKQKLSGTVFGAHNAFWTSNGVVRAWEGVSYPYADKTQKGELIEVAANGSKTSTMPLSSNAVAPHPNSIVFLISDSQGILPTISKLSSVQAAQHLLAGYKGSEKSFEPFFGRSLATTVDPNAIVKGFKKLVDDNKVDVYIINSNIKGKQIPPEDLQKLLASTVDGSAAAAKTAAGFATLSPITSLGSVRSLDGGSSTKEHQLTDYIKTTFPSVTF